MDYKFINDRFVRGKVAVEKFQELKHRLVQVPNLVLGHSVVVGAQTAMGTNVFLGYVNYKACFACLG